MIRPGQLIRFSSKSSNNNRLNPCWLLSDPKQGKGLKQLDIHSNKIYMFLKQRADFFNPSTPYQVPYVQIICDDLVGWVDVHDLNIDIVNSND